MALTRALEVEGRPIRVHDGLVALPHIKQLTDAFMRANFVRDEAARADTGAFRHWELNIPLDAAPQLVVYRPTMDALREFPGGAGATLERCYCNHASYGDMLFIHTDVQANQSPVVTALWYIAPEWNPEWGGETLFYNAQLDAEAVVTPKPGRLVIFDGAIPHVGRPPNRMCYAPRYTLAFKMDPARA